MVTTAAGLPVKILTSWFLNLMFFHLFALLQQPSRRPHYLEWISFSGKVPLDKLGTRGLNIIRTIVNYFLIYHLTTPNKISVYFLSKSFQYVRPCKWKSVAGKMFMKNVLVIILLLCPFLQRLANEQWFNTLTPVVY